MEKRTISGRSDVTKIMGGKNNFDCPISERRTQSFALSNIPKEEGGDEREGKGAKWNDLSIKNNPRTGRGSNSPRVKLTGSDENFLCA